MATATAPSGLGQHLQRLQDLPKQAQDALQQWVTKQPAWVDGVAQGLMGSVQGAFLGTVMGFMTKMSAETAGAAGSALPAGMMQAGPLVQARNFAVMTGVNTGIAAYMKRVRGVEDINNSIVAAFGSGFCFSLVSGMGSKPAPGAMPGAPAPNALMGAFSAGVVFAIFQGGFYKLGEMFGGPKVEENRYVKVSAMLANLGLSKYEKNVKRGLLDDDTIPLWDAPSLAEVRIPPGPRLLILDHIDQYRDILRPAVPIPRGGGGLAAQ
eukprot:scaffold7.g3471.t1